MSSLLLSASARRPSNRRPSSRRVCTCDCSQPSTQTVSSFHSTTGLTPNVEAGEVSNLLPFNRSCSLGSLCLCFLCVSVCVLCVPVCALSVCFVCMCLVCVSYLSCLGLVSLHECLLHLLTTLPTHLLHLLHPHPQTAQTAQGTGDNTVRGSHTRLGEGRPRKEGRGPLDLRVCAVEGFLMDL